jgi:hypothetical protein
MLVYIGLVCVCLRMFAWISCLEYHDRTSASVFQNTFWKPGLKIKIKVGYFFPTGFVA